MYREGERPGALALALMMGGTPTYEQQCAAAERQSKAHLRAAERRIHHERTWHMNDGRGVPFPGENDEGRR